MATPFARLFPNASLGVVVPSVVAVLFLAYVLSRSISFSPQQITGYVTADNIYLSAPIAGRVAKVDVLRGQRVAAGTPLFTIDPTTLSAREEAARAQLGEAQAQRAALDADLASARAAARKAAADLSRLRNAQAISADAVSAQQLDTARTAATQSAGTVENLLQHIAAAESTISSTQAVLQEASHNVAELSPVAPAPGRIEEVMYQVGEWAPANAIVVSLVPDSGVRIRFYVPQGRVRTLGYGKTVMFTCDGCGSPQTARINYIAPRPEYTPPVIYSRDTRDKLVFLVEASPTSPTALIVGQPLDVSLGD